MPATETQEKLQLDKSRLVEALKKLCDELHRGRKYSVRKDFSLLSADAAARNLIHEMENPTQ